MRGGLGPRHWGEGGSELSQLVLKARSSHGGDWEIELRHSLGLWQSASTPSLRNMSGLGRGMYIREINVCTHTHSHTHTFIHPWPHTALSNQKQAWFSRGSTSPLYPCVWELADRERLPQMPLGLSITRKASVSWRDQSVHAQDDRVAAFEMSFAEAYRHSHSTGPK